MHVLWNNLLRIGISVSEDLCELGKVCGNENFVFPFAPLLWEWTHYLERKEQLRTRSQNWTHTLLLSVKCPAPSWLWS